MGKIVRMADIAARLGVSTVTVSKALGDQKGVSEELRERIKQMAGEMGYKAPSANRSEEKKSYNIGVLVAEIYIEKYATFYWELYQKITTAAVKEDCFVLLEVLESAAEKELQDIKLIRENKIDGLIVLGSVSTEYLERLCRGNDLPIVCMDFYDNKVKVDCVISNSFYGAYQLTNYLFDKGHQKIAFVGTLLATDSITDRYLGYQKSLMEHGVAVEKKWVIPDRDESRECFDHITFPREMPTAFVCNCDLTASILHDELKKIGYDVPEDISIVGYDNYLYGHSFANEVTTYNVDMEQMAKEAVHILLKRVKGISTHAGIHYVDSKVVERTSVKERTE